MAFEGGPLNVIGITPTFVQQLASQTIQSGVKQAVGQLWKGSGQTFLGQAGQALVGSLASSAVNVALSPILGSQISGPRGLSLTSGNNILASAVTPFVTSTLAAGINQQIQNSLKSAGPFGSLLSQAGASITSQVLGSVTGGILGSISGGSNYKMFPGGGEEDPANYEGKAYTLNDIVFSLQPANKGPSMFGMEQATNTPLSPTVLAFNQSINLPAKAGSLSANALKEAAMGFSTKTNLPFDANAAFTSNSFSATKWVASSLPLAK